MEHPSEWRPILRGAEVASAQRVVGEIADALRHPDPAWLEHPRRGRVATLGAREPFIALLFCYLDESDPDCGHAATSELLFDQGLKSLASTRLSGWLYDGIAGIGWLAAHLQPRVLSANVKMTAMDEALGALVRRNTWRRDYDSVSGLVGLGIYFLERLPDPNAIECLTAIVGHLESRACSDGSGKYLLSPPNESIPDGIMARPHINLGVAHGMPGAIALLGRVCAAGVDVERTRPLLDGFVSFLMKRADPTHTNWFPLVIDPEDFGEGRPERLGWCYGDLGIAAALLMTARCVGEERWEQLATEVAEAATLRRGPDTGVVDACVCHGAAGNFHLFNRLYQATGRPKLEDAARHWFNRALGFQEPGVGVAGFRTQVRVDEQEVWRDAPGMLSGAAGVGLALLAGMSETQPQWDRLLEIAD